MVRAGRTGVCWKRSDLSKQGASKLFSITAIRARSRTLLVKLTSGKHSARICSFRLLTFLAGNVKKPKQRRTLDVPLKDLYAHACNVRARLDGVGYVKTWERFAIRVERRQSIPKSAGGLKIEPRISLAYLESDEGKTVGQKLIALALFDVFDRLKTLKKVYKEGKPKNKRSMAYSEFQLAENARHYFGSKYFDDDNYWKERQA